jgi:nitroimidazol reductase NimA-like FMN-containing flavoprotein (pyridoxamine 5'-phosphate oxidase superfamily)
MSTRPRTLAERQRDTRHRLENDVDVWVATAPSDGSGIPYLVPLSYLWDGHTLLIATPAASATSRNLRASGRVRLALGPTRDLVIIEGVAEPLATDDISAELGDAFAARTGFDPRELSDPYQYFRIQPRRIQAWREADELTGRDLMRDGFWLTS